MILVLLINITLSVESKLVYVSSWIGRIGHLIIENLNDKIRKYTKAKLSFPMDDTLKKSVYLAIMEIDKKWTMLIMNLKIKVLYRACQDMAFVWIMP